jgi:hypothetical protein
MSVSLRELQEKFKAYILNENADILNINVISTKSANAIERIDIYKEGYVLRLLEIMEKDFPIFRQIVGEDFFKKIACGYIERYPSYHFSICMFSRHLSKYLLEMGYEPYLSEIVTFEWALSCALDALDAPQIGVDYLSTVAPESWPDIQFTFHPSLELYEFDFNVPQVVYAHMTHQETIPEINREESKGGWIIWRYALSSYFESVTPAQVGMIQAIREEKTFAELCEGLCQWLPEEEVAQFAAASLRNWLEKGVFSAINVKVKDSP